ncbi:MAG TPA: hypothetical protein VF041_07870 [Gemmatimonadaceae bacterium]
MHDAPPAVVRRWGVGVVAGSPVAGYPRCRVAGNRILRSGSGEGASGAGMAASRRARWRIADTRVRGAP